MEGCDHTNSATSLALPLRESLWVFDLSFSFDGSLDEDLEVCLDDIVPVGGCEMLRLGAVLDKG